MESSTDKKTPVSASGVWTILAGLLLVWHSWNPVKAGKFDSAQIFCLLTMALLMIRSLLIIIEDNVQMPGRVKNTEKCIKLIIYTFACILYLWYCCKANQAVVTSSINSALVGAAFLAASSIASEALLGRKKM